MQLSFLCAKRLSIAHWALVVTLALVLPAAIRTTAAPAPQPTSVAEQARLRRGAQIREILLDALEQSYRNNGEWPDRLAPAAQGAPKLVYLKPEKIPQASELGPFKRASSRSAVSVVLHELIEENPVGVWVGYADGHLEFAASASELAACQNQWQIVRNAPADAATQPAPTSGQLTLKILDPQGQPVVGAEVGTYANFGNIHPRFARFQFAGADKPAISNEQGEVIVAAVVAFDAKFSELTSVPIYILDEQRRLIAQIELRRSDFSGQKTRQVHLSGACNVHGQFTSVGLIAVGRNLSWTNAIAFKPGQLGLNTLSCTSTAATFSFLLPSGDYGIEAYGTDCDDVHRYFHIEPGQREMNLKLDLPADRIAQLVGHPAPELRNIKGWEHGGPVTLADLRGKVVLLDFWGYWCGPCVAGMPALMKLHDEFKDKGLVIIAVHDDSVDSIKEMDRKLEKTRQEPWAGWGGRDLPFLIALDGGGATRVKYTSEITRGATTAAYGIMGFPTTLAIGRDGRLVGEVSVQTSQGRLEIEKLLDAKN